MPPHPMSDRVRLAYQRLHQIYANETDGKLIHCYYERPAMLALAGDVAGRRILEPGAASGFYTERFADQGAEVIAFDLMPEFVEHVRRRVGGRATVLQADLHDSLTFVADASLDLVFCSLVLHYVEDWDRLFAEFHRKLKPGGEFVFSTHHPFMDYTLFAVDDYFEVRLLEDHWTKDRLPVYFFRRPLQAIINPLLRAGFQLAELVEARPTHPDRYRAEAPEEYERLRTRPWFLCVKAVKPLA